MAGRPSKDARGGVTNPSMRSGVCVLPVVLLCGGCVLGARPAAVPEDGEPTAVLASGPLMEPLHVLARHAWFAVRDRGQTEWERWEIWRHDASECDVWGYVCRRNLDALSWGGGEGSVRVHSILRGAEATRFIACLRAAAPVYPNRSFYAPWPGPNSNTFVDVMLRQCGWEASLPATAVGKDYRGFFGASLTSGGTGIQLESAMLGLKVGLKEGIQIHVLALTLGIDFWPFAIEVPGGIGRIGWEDE